MYICIYITILEAGTGESPNPRNIGDGDAYDKTELLKKNSIV
jgi:hypothetical protein